MSHLDSEKDVKNLGGGGQHVENLDYKGDRRGTVIADNFNDFIGDAVEAVDQQKSQTIREALAQYKYGIMYSIIFSR